MSFGEEVVIVPYRDGPYLVRGPVSLRDQQGNEIALAREPIALCRCGRSRIRPFCDGTHRITRFAAPSELEAPATSGVQTTDGIHPASGPQTTNRKGVRRSAVAEPMRAELLRAAKLIDLALQGMGSEGELAEGAPDSVRAATALREVARRLEGRR